jgi:hypothetical protein
MSKGKRLLRNTVFALWGWAALYVGATRLYATTDADTAPWLRTALSLGLKPSPNTPRPRDINLATVRDFTHVSVSGRFNVEVVGGMDYKVVVTPEAGQEIKYHAWRDDETLRIWQENDDKGPALATLHIEVPTLARLSINASHLTVRGIKSPELALVSYGLESALLQQNEVASWRMFSGVNMEVRMDDATFAAGSVKSNGDVVIRRAE